MKNALLLFFGLLVSNSLLASDYGYIVNKGSKSKGKFKTPPSIRKLAQEVRQEGSYDRGILNDEIFPELEYFEGDDMLPDNDDDLKIKKLEIRRGLSASVQCFAKNLLRINSEIESGKPRSIEENIEFLHRHFPKSFYFPAHPVRLPSFLEDERTPCSVDELLRSCEE